MKGKVRIPTIGDMRFKHWAKELMGVDTTQKNGYAFLGEFVPTDRLVEVEHGTLFLLYGESGSRKYPKPVVAMIRAVKLFKDHEVTFEPIFRAADLDPSWALQIRDQVAYHIGVNEKRNKIEKVNNAFIVYMDTDEAHRQEKAYGISYTFYYKGETHDYVQLDEAVTELGEMMPTPSWLNPSYVVGYLFNDDGTEVALILKDHPEDQVGKLNGIGGRIEGLEDSQMAMIREFGEETGITVMDMVTKATELWQHTIYLQGPEWKVLYYRAFSTELIERLKAKTDWPTSEPVVVVSVKDLPKNIFSHVDWTVAISVAPGIRFPFRVDDGTKVMGEDNG